MECVTNKACQNRFNTLLSRHRSEEAASARVSGVEEEFTELRRLMGDIKSDFDEWEIEKQRDKNKNKEEADAKDCTGALVRDSVMLRLREQRLAEQKQFSKTSEGAEATTGSSTSATSKDIPIKGKNAILASLLP
ncbi:hypothetical protein PI124_g5977 [Phytophthora idaei]|nr:hypothetical protein PI125_g22724 [Phytophthora idaei]KAG3129528.1 hypothetical protein PI126_g20927 [Phytophthora idaei]KAG3249352.1 hypothetical protein PI124_g5977 [Phytophthora idaei]